MLNSITVVIHITGLLLIVPPHPGGNTTYVVMPPHGTPKHAARIGFEGPNTAGLCVAHLGGICYVDMNTWSLDPIGAGGTPATPTIDGFPREVINLTHGSGNQHRVNTSTLGNQVLATFVAGRPTRPCSLGQWYYNPVGALNQRIVAIANVLDWEIRLPGSSLQLVFRRRDNSATVPVTLEPPFGTINLLIAHLPAGELNRLPPGRPNRPLPPGFLARPTHFDDLYNPLGIEPGDSRRRLPRFFTSIREDACPVRVNTNLARFNAQVWTVDTYSCMLAAAEPR